MSRRFYLLPLSALTVSALQLSACSDSVRMQHQIDRMEQSINAMRTIQASHTSDIDSMRSEVQSLSGRLDELQHFQDQRIGREVSVLRDDISNLRSRVPPPAIIPLAALEADEEYLKGLNTPGSRLILDSVVFIRDAKYSEADALLQNALEYGPSDGAFVYAVFWSGVAADGRGDNPGALRAYNDVVVKYPKHIRSPLALFRQADVFVRLKDKNAASFALKKLIADYPKSAEAGQAKQKLIEISRK